MKAFKLKRFDSLNEEKIVLLPSELEAMKKEAFENGKEEGFLNGRNEGFALGEKSEMEKNNKINLEMIAKINNKISQDLEKIANNNDKFYTDISKEFLDLLKTISEKYFDKIAEIDFIDNVKENLSQLLANSKIQNNIQIEVSEVAEKPISQFILEKFSDESLKINVKGNPDFTMYDVKICNEDGFYERTLSQIKNDFNNIFIEKLQQ